MKINLNRIVNEFLNNLFAMLVINNNNRNPGNGLNAKAENRDQVSTL